MQAIYEPKGMAREYAPLALNLYRGCSHGCYGGCYAVRTLHMTREEFANPAPRPGILDALAKDLETWDPRDVRNVLLSFTSDPYQEMEARELLTRRALELMSGRVAHVTVLTKAASLVLRDLDIFQANPLWTLGWTITSMNSDTSREWEPKAPEAKARWQMMQTARAHGIPVWVSVEPVIVPEEALYVVRECMLQGIPVRVGRWNHDARANKIDWAKFLRDVLDLAAQCSVVRLYVKDELAKAGPVPAQFRVRPLG